MHGATHMSHIGHPVQISLLHLHSALRSIIGIDADRALQRG